jgi:hypothetical protein
MTQVRYIGAHDEVTLTIGGVDHDVKRGASIDVPAVLAGAPPSKAWQDAEAALVASQALPFPERHPAEAAARLAFSDLPVGAEGSGLLAQVENWQPVAAKTAKAEKDGE